jgi:GNAT superfamily N-acetyltransferase
MRIRPYTVADTERLVDLQRDCFPPPFPPELWWTPAQIAGHARIFADGALCVEADDGSLIASATAHRVNLDLAHPQHRWADISADGTLANHDPQGDTLYGVDMAVRPAWRRRGVARSLYVARFALVRRLGLRRFAAGCRLSGYHRHAADMDIDSYGAAVMAGRLVDPVATPLLRAGLRGVAVLHDYLPDAESHNHALLVVWNLPDHG